MSKRGEFYCEALRLTHMKTMVGAPEGNLWASVLGTEIRLRTQGLPDLGSDVYCLITDS